MKESSLEKKRAYMREYNKKPEVVARYAARLKELVPLYRNPIWLNNHLNRKSFIRGGYMVVPCPPEFCAMANSLGMVFEHRKVAASQIGRKLERTEIVHHIDGDKLNNAPWNLALYASVSDHHLGKEPIWDGSKNDKDIAKLKRIWDDIFCMCMCVGERGQEARLDTTPKYGDGYLLASPSIGR